MHTWGLTLGLILFNCFINDPDDETECTLSKFTYGIKPGGVADIQDHCAAIQSDLNRLEKKAEKNPLNSTKGNVKSCTGEE